MVKERVGVESTERQNEGSEGGIRGGVSSQYVIYVSGLPGREEVRSLR